MRDEAALHDDREHDERAEQRAALPHDTVAVENADGHDCCQIRWSGFVAEGSLAVRARDQKCEMM